MIFSFSLCISCVVHTRGKSPWGWLGDANLWNNLGFSLYTMLPVYHMVVISEERKKSKIGVSVDWYVTIKH